jgi:hypothetical protein
MFTKNLKESFELFGRLFFFGGEELDFDFVVKGLVVVGFGVTRVKDGRGE